MALRDIVIRIKADISNARRGLDDLTERADRNAAAFDRVGKAALAFGTAAAAGLALSAREAIKWESAFAGVTKTVDGTAAELGALGDELRRMAREDVPMSATGLAEIAAAAGQLGIKTENIAGFTRVMADLGVATNLTGEEAAMTLAQFGNITGLDQSQYDRLGSTIVDLGNNTATTEADIADMAIRLASAGTQAGLTEAEILGLSAAARSVGIEAEAGGTAFSRVLIEMRNAAMDGGAALEVLAETAGMSAEEFRAAFEDNAAGALVTFTEGLALMEQQGGNSNTVLEELGLADIRVGNALRSAATAGDLFRDSLAMGSDAWEDNLALTAEAEARYQTTESQLQFAKNAAVDLAIELGEHLLPAINTVADGFGILADDMGNIDDPLQQAAVTVAGLAGAVGILSGATLLLIPRLAAAATTLRTFGSGSLLLGAARMTGVGAAATVAAVGIGVLTRQYIEGRQKVLDYTSAIEADTGALGANTSAQIENAVAKADMYDDLALLGVSTETFTAAVRGQATALAEVEAATSAEALAAAVATDQYGLMVQAANLVAAVLQVETAAVEQSTVAFREDELARSRASESALSFRSAVEGGMAPTSALNRLLADTATASTDVATDAGLAAVGIDDMAGAAGEATGATDSWRQALAGAGIDTEAFGQGVESYMRNPLLALTEALTPLVDPLAAYADLPTPPPQVDLAEDQELCPA